MNRFAWEKCVTHKTAGFIHIMLAETKLRGEMKKKMFM